MYKGENQIYADIVSVLNTAISEMNITGWGVTQRNQPTPQTLQNGKIFFDFISTKRLGWQRHYDKYVDGEIVHIEEWQDEVLFQLSAFKKREVTDTTATLTSGDVIKRLAQYLQGLRGVELLKSKGYGVLRITDIRSQPFKDDSDLYEKMPSVDISFVLVQNVETDENSVGALNLTMKGL